MKRRVTIFCAIFVLNGFCGIVYAQKQTLPGDLKTILDKEFPFWQFDEDADKSRSKKTDEPKSWTRGDWNADGRTDFIVFIKHQNKRKTIVFLRHETGYIFYGIFPGDGNFNSKNPTTKNS